MIALLLAWATAHANDLLTRRFESQTRRGCAVALNAPETSRERLAGELMLTPAALDELLTVVRHAGVWSGSDGVVFAGPRRHRAFVGDLGLRLIFVPRATFDLGAFRREVERFAAAPELKAFGRAHDLVVRAETFPKQPHQLSPARDSRAARGRLAADYRELLLAIELRGDVLPSNLFAGAGPFDGAFNHEAALETAFASALKGRLEGEATFLLKSHCVATEAWLERLNQLRYQQVYLVDDTGALRDGAPPNPAP